jgi:hypothetical protein
MPNAVDESARPNPMMMAAAQVSPDTANTTAVIATRRNHDLRQPEPENVAPHLPEPRWLEFQPDDEQQQHHAEFGKMQDLLSIGDDPQHGADHDAGRKIAQNGPEPDFLEQRCRDNCTAQKNEAFGVKAGVSCGHQWRSFCSWNRRNSKQTCVAPGLMLDGQDNT